MEWSNEKAQIIDRIIDAIGDVHKDLGLPDRKLAECFLVAAFFGAVAADMKGEEITDLLIEAANRTLDNIRGGIQ